MAITYYQDNTIKTIAQNIRTLYQEHYSENKLVKLDKHHMHNLVNLLGGTLHLSKLNKSNTIANTTINTITNTENQLFSINIAQDSEYQTYQIAHAIGHLLLHMGYLLDDAKWTTTLHVSPTYIDSAKYRRGHHVENYEADIFALELLMPHQAFCSTAKLFSEQQGKYITYQTEHIATHFDTPEHLIITRGRSIGLFSFMN